MTREETKMIIGMLGAVYSSEFDRKTDEQINTMVDVWTMLLEDEDANKIATVTKAYLKSNTNAFMPTPAMLINMAYELFTPKGMSEQQAWNTLYKAICNSGYNAKYEYDRLPLEIQELTSPSQMRDWAIDEHPNWNVTSSNFMRSFREREKQRNDYAKLPNETKTLISELNAKLKLGNKGDDEDDK